MSKREWIRGMFISKWSFHQQEETTTDALDKAEYKQ